MSRNITLYIKDILQNMQDAIDFIGDMSYEQFVDDKKTLNAVLRSIESIGEATKNVPEELRANYPDVPWKEMAGMRDKVIHFYFGVDKEVVWFVVKDRIPTIQPFIQQALRALEKQAHEPQ